MDLIRLSIPYRFIHERTPMSWRDIRFGLKNELLDPHAAVEMAVEQLGEREDPTGALIKLAWPDNYDPVELLVEELAEAEPPASEEEIRKKWLYLVLAWIYEHRDEDPDPLQRVEEVYADFDYPEEIASFVGYMPMTGPPLGSKEAAIRRMFQRWKLYIDDAARLYRPS